METFCVSSTHFWPQHGRHSGIHFRKSLNSGESEAESEPLVRAQGINNTNTQVTDHRRNRNFAGSNRLPLKIRAKEILMGAPTFDGQVNLTVVETESCVGAPTEAAPGAHLRRPRKF